MIKNERQYRITRAQAARLKKSLEAARKRVNGDSGLHPLIAKAQEDAMSSQLVDLEEELRDYETLKAGGFDLDALKSVGEIPRMLIKARIAKGLSQKELAERLGLKEQQIQRYEATEYATASLARIREVAAVYEGGGGGVEWGLQPHIRGC